MRRLAASLQHAGSSPSLAPPDLAAPCLPCAVPIPPSHVVLPGMLCNASAIEPVFYASGAYARGRSPATTSMFAATTTASTRLDEYFYEKLESCMRKLKKADKIELSKECSYRLAMVKMSQGMDMAIMLNQLDIQKYELYSLHCLIEGTLTDVKNKSARHRQRVTADFGFQSGSSNGFQAVLEKNYGQH